MTHLIPSKARKQRNSSAEVRDYRPLARGPQAQNPGNHPLLFYKISHTKHFALIPCHLPDCAPAHCSPPLPPLVNGIEPNSPQHPRLPLSRQRRGPANQTCPHLQTSTESLLPAIPARRPACEETKKGRDVPPLSGLQSLPPSGDGRDLTTKKTFYGATGLRPSSAGALTFTPWLMLRLSPAGTSTFQNRL